MFEQPGNQHRLAVGHCVNVDLDPFKESVDPQRAIGGDAADPLQLALELLRAVGEVDRKSADHIRRSHDHRVADPRSKVERILATAGEAAVGLQHAESIQKCGEANAILGLVDRIKRRAEERHAGGGERRGEVERRLSAELHKGRER